MTITVNVEPEVQAELIRQAAAQGIALEPYAASLLEEAARAGGAPNAPRQAALEQTLQDLAQFSHKIPLLPDKAFSRESLYRDHD
jgi:hypothetical protein